MPLCFFLLCRTVVRFVDARLRSLPFRCCCVRYLPAARQSARHYMLAPWFLYGPPRESQIEGE